MLQRALLAFLAPVVVVNSQGLCATLHCGIQLGACALEKECRGILQCTVACKGDMSCEYTCGTEAVSPANEALVVCMQENKCLPTVNDTTTPDDFTKDLSKLVTVPFEKEDMYGRWWINYGLNVALDCVPCQSYDIFPNPQNESFYSVHQTFRSMHNRVWNSVNYTALFDPEDASRGMLASRYVQAGFGGGDVWYILGIDGDEMLMAYLADSNWVTHGIQVMSRANTRVVANVDKWRKVLEANGIHWENVCHADVVSGDCGKAVNEIII